MIDLIHKIDHCEFSPDFDEYKAKAVGFIDEIVEMAMVAPRLESQLYMDFSDDVHTLKVKITYQFK